MKSDKFIEITDFHKRIISFSQGYRQNIALLGDDNEQNNSFFDYCLLELKVEGLVIVRATTDYNDQNGFFKCLVISLLSNFLHKEDTLDNLISSASFTLPETTTIIKNILKNSEVKFYSCLEVINKFIKETGRKCLFIIEEFLELGRLFPDFYRDFSKFVILQKECMLVISSSYLRESLKQLDSELNLLFGNFEKIYANKSRFIDNYLYFKGLLQSVSVSPFFISYFVNIFGKNKNYYDLVADIIKNNYKNNNDENLILNVLEKILLTKESYFTQKFLRKIDQVKNLFRDYLLVLKLLLSLSDGYLRKKELAALNIYNFKDISAKLQKLVDEEYVENLGNIYKIKDPLFSFWLTYVFRFSLVNPITNFQARKNLAIKRIKEDIISFKADMRKDYRKKVLELIASFNNDILSIEENKYVLPLIEKAEIINSPNKDLAFLIGEGEEIIFAGIKLKEATESDIFEFVEQGRNINGKGIKKIFISMDKCSNNTKLIAKNNKLIVWDIDDMNKLFSIYNKSILPLENSTFEYEDYESIKGRLKFKRLVDPCFLKEEDREFCKNESFSSF